MASTYLTVYPAGVTGPLSSDLNATANAVVPNLAISGTTTGAVDISNAAGGSAQSFDLAG